MPFKAKKLSPNGRRDYRRPTHKGIETVIGVAKEIPVRGVRRLSRGLLTHYENPPAPPADVVVPMLRGA